MAVGIGLAVTLGLGIRLVQGPDRTGPEKVPSVAGWALCSLESVLGKRVVMLGVASACALAAMGCGSSQSGASRSTQPVAAAAQLRDARTAPRVTTVVAISVDGLNPRAIRLLGADRAPTFHRLIAEGASTLNARTEREQTNTLPNHTGMVTSRRIQADRGGHGVTWNDERRYPRTVQAAAGHRVVSVFDVAHRAGLHTALFASKTKFSLFNRSWPRAIDKYVELDNNNRLIRRVCRDISRRQRAFRFVHLSAPDSAGHANGFMSASYLDAVASTDRRIGRVINTIEADPALAGHTTVIVTADHGGKGPSHRDPTKLYNYRIPFLVWGARVAAGASLYSLNSDYANPHRSRTGYSARRQPVRNGDVANLATDLLGLRSVRGSEHDRRQTLDVR